MFVDPVLLALMAICTLVLLIVAHVGWSLSFRSEDELRWTKRRLSDVEAISRARGDWIKATELEAEATIAPQHVRSVSDHWTEAPEYDREDREAYLDRHIS